MNINNIEIGKEYKWKELCNVLGIKVSEGNSRKKDIKQLESLCKYKKEGVRFMIEEIYDIPKHIEDKRKYGYIVNVGDKYFNVKNSKYSHLELFKTKYYVYYHKIDNKVIYVGKGTNYRCVDSNGRKYNPKDNNVEIGIFMHFDDEQEALEFEKETIEYYQSIGQCRFNDTEYHVGNRREKHKHSKSREEIEIINRLKELKENKKIILEEEKILKDKLKQLIIK